MKLIIRNKKDMTGVLQRACDHIKNSEAIYWDGHKIISKEQLKSIVPKYLNRPIHISISRNTLLITPVMSAKTIHTLIDSY